MSRFADPQDPRFRAINTSIGFDYRLAPHDLDQSLAHARMLARVGILDEDELAQLERGLADVRSEIEDGRFEVNPDDEDIHMAIERRLTEIVGPVGGKLHTARSRNDQVATDIALFVHERAHVARKMICELMGLLAQRAEEHLDWPMPGYTHLQRAQPVYLSHHLMAHFWRLRRDAQRFEFCAHQAQVMPLGSGALAGVNFETDRDGIAAELGFTWVAPNSLDAVSNRDFVLDYLSAAAICATHLSQLGSELVLWSSDEFSFCELPDAFASGSSIMPQKKNPDAAELLRAKAPRIVAHLTALHGVVHALPLAYNKDLQEDKEHLFDTVDTIELALNAASGMIDGVRFNRDRLAQAASDQMLAATDVADLLVKRGVPFRQAHGVVAGLVRHSIERGVALSELSEDELAELAPSLDSAYYDVLAQSSWLESKVSAGGTAIGRVREQLEYAREILEQQASLTR
jgi:argininosuccinate lyase